MVIRTIIDRQVFQTVGAVVDNSTVTVVISIYNQSRFLADAIHSVLAQTRPAEEIIVVDDGSTDHPEKVVSQFRNLRLVCQSNRGLAAARNTGLRLSSGRYVLFLDADDRLLPTAIEAGLRCISARPDCGFVYGGYRHISKSGDPISPGRVNSPDANPHLSLLLGNFIGMHATVLYRRDCLLAVNGFDETLRLVEDYDLYLRITQKYPIGSHSEIIAEYRRHGQNMSDNVRKMYRAGYIVLERHEGRIAADPIALATLKSRRANRRAEYVHKALGAAARDWRSRRGLWNILSSLALAAQLSPFFAMRLLFEAFRRRAISWIDHAILIYLPDKAATHLRFTVCHGYIPSLEHPSTFSERLLIKLLSDRNPSLTETTDKLAVRKYVEKMWNPTILVPILQVVDRVEDLNFALLPEQFVLKATHGSGMVEIVRDKSAIDEAHLRARLNSWLKSDYYQLYREWQYKDIPHRIIAEEALLNTDDQPPCDYKLYVFNGCVRLIHVDVERFFDHRRSLFDREWNLLKVTYKYPSAGDHPKPATLDKMIAIAEALAGSFAFVRVDLYQHNGRVYFGEITHTPEAGLETFDPRDFDHALGQVMISAAPVPSRYRARLRND